MRQSPYARDERSRWYRAVEKGRPVKEVCEIFRISRKCYYKWYFRDIGHKVYKRRECPSQRQPALKLTRDVCEFIKETKLKTNYGPVRMQMALKKHLGLRLSTTIIYRFFRKERLIRRPQRRLAWYEPMKQKLVIKKPGQGVQMDVKYVYENGKRRYQFSVFDPLTELYHFTICDTKESRNSIAAYKAAERYFGFKIVSVQTDNGSEARGEFHKWLTQKQIPHYFIPKKSPWWNAKVERVHRTIDDEYYHNPWRTWKTPQEWLEYYNGERIHTTLKGLTPREKQKESVTLRC